MLDVAFIAGWQGVRRLRPIDRWPAFQLYFRRDDGSQIGDEAASLPILPDRKPGDWMLDDFCSGAVPEIHAKDTTDGVCYEFGRGPVGRTGDFGCFYGNRRTKAVARHATETDRLGMFHVGVTIPAAVLLFDLFVHRDLSEALSPEVLVQGRLQTHYEHEDHAVIRLPISTRVHNLGRDPAVSTPLVKNYDGLIGAAMAGGGWNPADFHCLRLVLEYPPMPSTVTMRYPLPDTE